MAGRKQQAHLKLHQQQVQCLHDDAGEAERVGPCIKRKISDASYDAADNNEHDGRGELLWVLCVQEWAERQQLKTAHGMHVSTSERARE